MRASEDIAKKGPDTVFSSASVLFATHMVFVVQVPNGTVFMHKSARGDPHGIFDIAADLMRHKISVVIRVMSMAEAF